VRLQTELLIQKCQQLLGAVDFLIRRGFHFFIRPLIYFVHIKLNYGRGGMEFAWSSWALSLIPKLIDEVTEVCDVPFRLGLNFLSVRITAESNE